MSEFLIGREYKIEFLDCCVGGNGTMILLAVEKDDDDDDEPCYVFGTHDGKQLLTLGGNAVKLKLVE